MKKVFSFAFVIMSAFVFTTSAASNASDAKTAMMSELVRQSQESADFGINLPDFRQNCVEDPVSDVFVPQFPPPTPVPQQQPGQSIGVATQYFPAVDVTKVCGKSNGLVTVLAVGVKDFSSSGRIQLRVALGDSSRPGAYPFQYHMPGLTHLVEGFGEDFLVFINFPEDKGRRSYAEVRPAVNWENVLFVPIRQEGSLFVITIPNAFLGNLGRGQMRVVAVGESQDGSKFDFAPNNGAFAVSATSRLRIATRGIVMIPENAVSGASPLTVVYEPEGGAPATASWRWIINGVDVSQNINGKTVNGVMTQASRPARAGYLGQVLTYLYDWHHLPVGRHSIFVKVEASQGVAVDEIEWEVVRVSWAAQ